MSMTSMVVVWPESEEREAWWRQVVTVGSTDATSATMTPNRSIEGRSLSGSARGIVRRLRRVSANDDLIEVHVCACGG